MSALPAYIELPEKRQDKARSILQKRLGVPLSQTDADYLIEGVWNALVGKKIDEGE